MELTVISIEIEILKRTKKLNGNTNQPLSCFSHKNREINRIRRVIIHTIFIERMFLP